MKLILRTTLPAFEALHAALAKVKQGTGKVSVPVDALRCLLTDHSNLNAALRGEIEEPRG